MMGPMELREGMVKEMAEECMTKEMMEDYKLVYAAGGSARNVASVNAMFGKMWVPQLWNGGASTCFWQLRILFKNKAQYQEWCRERR